MGDCLGLLVLLLSYPLPHVFAASRLTVASAADSWLVDPRVGCNKAYITCALWLYYLSGTPTLRSFIYEDVGEPTSHPCS